MYDKKDAVQVLVVLVTYNRQATLLKTLAALMQQSHQPAGILILDNCSTDETIPALKAQGFLKEDVKKSQLYMNHDARGYQYFYQNEFNAGGSGGFAKAIELATSLSEKYDYVWVMDDDVLPETDCLEKLLAPMLPGQVDVTIPCRDDANYRDSAIVKFELGKLGQYITETQKQRVFSPFTKETYVVEDMTFEGPLIAMDLVKQVGLPDASYFLLYDDSDYAQRLQAHSQILYVTAAKLHRQLSTLEQQFPSGKYFYNWKDYYQVRNNILFNKKYGQTWAVRHLSQFMIGPRLLIRSARNRSLKNDGPLIIKAWKDGILGKTGMRVGPNY
ncbi:glycosyltransferase [Ligilactobacillus equi]|nr:glycosyltransferase [Ligilactobacillus equi]